MVTDPSSLRYSDDNKKNTIDNGVMMDNGHGVKIVTCKQSLNLQFWRKST